VRRARSVITHALHPLRAPGQALMKDVEATTLKLDSAEFSKKLVPKLCSFVPVRLAARARAGSLPSSTAVAARRLCGSRSLCYAT
jgi:hypothetical protein